MKAQVLSIEGKPLKEIELPPHFSEPYRPDLIRRAAIAIQTHRLQPYGTDILAGLRKIVELFKRRRKPYRRIYGRGVSRAPKKIHAIEGIMVSWSGARAPFARGGRRAHPPRVERVLREEITKKERRKAIRSAIAASAREELVKQRRHRFEAKLPLVIEDKVEELNKAKEVEQLLERIGLKGELRRIKRGAKGPLFVVSKRCSLMKAASNLPGVDVCLVKDLNAELLAPGGQPARLIVWSESSLKELVERNLFC